MDEKNPLPGRITHRLNLDSSEEQKREQQQRLERQEYERQKQQKRKRKQQKRKAKQDQERAVKQAAQKQAQKRKKQLQIYNGKDKLYQPDSDSGVSFTRIKRKIQEMYPKFSKKKQKNQQSSDEDQQQDDENEQQQSDEQSDDDQQSSGEQEDSSNVKKNKKSKKSERKRHRQQDSEERQQRKKAKSSVKVQPQMSAKDKLVQQVAVRWNYALPQWPPVDYDYEGELKKKGFRPVQFSKFKFVDEVVDGLVKVYQLDGYKGVYRGKMGLIDVRPKDECPSLNYFYSKSQEQLNGYLKKALQKQIELLQEITYKQTPEQKLIEDLKRRLRQLTR